MAEIIKDPDGTEDNDFLFQGEGGAWITLENLSIWIVRRGDQGADVQIFASGKEIERPLARAIAFFEDGGE
jgi:hypothetical protein